MMQHRFRSSLLASLGVALMTGSLPLAAQRTTVTVRSGSRAENANERQLRVLQRRADSLAYLYNESDELSIAERRRVGEILDRTVEQLEMLVARLATMDDDAADGTFRMRLAPTMGSSQALMRKALAESHGVRPRGWIGIDISGVAREPRVENGDLIIRYLAHPAIVSVEPNSPAERAGLAPSDTLIAYDGYDLRDSDVPITRLLKPNKRVIVRVRRDGRTIDVPVRAADVPSRIVMRRDMSMAIAPPPPTSLPSVAFPRAPVAPRSAAPMAAAAPATAFAPGVPMEAPMPPPRVALGFSGLSAVAGAQLVAVTEGLGRAFGVRHGVLVTYAPVSSPAYESGLRDGDVITRAAGQLVRTVADLRQRVAAAADNGEHSLALELVRGKRARKGSLKW
jgi:C-terminal processing protease CtpA/Prc